MVLRVGNEQRKNIACLLLYVEPRLNYVCLYKNTLFPYIHTYIYSKKAEKKTLGWVGGTGKGFRKVTMSKVQ